MVLDYDKMTPAQRAQWEAAQKKAKRPHKYHAEATEYKGVKYPSKAEATRAMFLDDLKRIGLIAWWLRQVPIALGEDTVYRVDFLVGIRLVGADGDVGYIVHAEDVKGVETKEFKKIKKLWRKYGEFALDVVSLKNNDWHTTTIMPAAMEKPRVAPNSQRDRIVDAPKGLPPGPRRPA